MSEAVSVVLTTARTGDNVVKGLSVSDVRYSLQNFTWQNYTVFSFVFLICIIVGFYVSFFKAGWSPQDYLVGGRKMQTLPTIFSFLSGITVFGVPAETYVHGIHYIYITSGILLMGLMFERTFLPVFHGLNVTSIHEYLELRFDKRTRCFASILFAAATVMWLPIVIYVPALAFNRVSGINITIITPLMCAICIIYTCIGGLKAAIWTGVIQTIAMLIAMILIASKGTVDVGGYATVWIRSWEGGRLEQPNFNLNVLSRHSFWALLLGGFVVWLQTGAVNQIMMQRYLSIPDFVSARRVLWTFIIGIIFFQSLCNYVGLLIYTTYHKCDPLTTNLIGEKDQLLPLLMMDVLGDIPGLPGLFVAGILTAALSTLSTSLNSMAAIALEDFYKVYVSSILSEYNTQILMKATVVIFGTICLTITFVINKFGSILKIFMIVITISNGACLAIFCMGILLPWVTGIGAIAGGFCSLSVVTWLHIRMQTSKVSEDVYFSEKTVSVDGCDYQFTPQESPFVLLHLNVNKSAHLQHADETFILYGFSYLWYTSLAALIAITIGLLVSFMFGRNDPRDVDPILLAPFIRKLIKPREFPNQPDGNEIIYAYKRKTVNVEVSRKETIQPDNNGSVFVQL